MADMVTFIAFCISMYLWAEATSLGATVVAPFVLKNKEDKEAAIHALKPMFQANELWLAAAVWWTLAMFPSIESDYRMALYTGSAFAISGMVLRQMAVWGAADGSWACLRRTLNLLLALGTVFFMFTLAITFLLNVGLGSVTIGSLYWSPLGIVTGVWACLGFSVYGALFLAWKSQNPLRERARAASLVIGAVSILVHVVLLVALYAVVAIPTDMLVYFVLSSLLGVGLYGAAFVLSRRRKLGQAYACVFLSGPVMIAMYLFWIHSLLSSDSQGTYWGEIAAHIPAVFLLLPAIALVGGIVGMILRVRRVPEERQREFGWRRNS